MLDKAEPKAALIIWYGINIVQDHVSKALKLMLVELKHAMICANPLDEAHILQRREYPCD
jgi:hypothetical protein